VIEEASHLVVESTYGDRLHTGSDPLDLLESLITRTARRGGSVVIPSFAATVVASAVLSFRREYWTRGGRIHYALVAAAMIVFLLQLHYWNLLGWRF
jgi:Cft2 family RNA processing exonuclease